MAQTASATRAATAVGGGFGETPVEGGAEHRAIAAVAKWERDEGVSGASGGTSVFQSGLFIVVGIVGIVGGPDDHTKLTSKWDSSTGEWSGLSWRP